MKRSKAALVMLVLLVACMSNNASPTPTSSSATFDPDAFRALACDEVARGFATLRKDVKLPPAVLLAQLQSDTAELRDNLEPILEQASDDDLELHLGLADWCSPSTTWRTSMATASWN